MHCHCPLYCVVFSHHPCHTTQFKAAPLRADAATRAPKTPGSAARPVAPRYTPLVMQNSAKSPTGVSGKARGTTSARKVREKGI